LSAAGGVDRASLVGLARDLVSADTSNPPGGELPAVDVLQPVFEGLGAECERVEPEPGRVSLIARLPAPRPDAPTLLVNGHVDVVPADPRGWEHHPFSGHDDGVRLHGRGAVDMKGGIASAVEGVRALRRLGREPACGLLFYLVADEETGSALGTAKLVRSGTAEADACLVPEPTGLQMAVAECGVVWATVTIRGSGGHAAYRTGRASAIAAACDIVRSLEYGAWRAHAEHPLLGAASINVGVIEGGSLPNVIAEECRLKLDRRTLPEESEDAVVAELRQAIEYVGTPEHSVEVFVEDVCLPSETDARHPFVSLCQRSVTEATGRPTSVTGLRGCTDARFLRNEASLPTVVCGPGDIRTAHAAGESVRVAELLDAARSYAALYAAFDGSPTA
jgi:acetylornithine deacetylase/succinyl-diaminopimelate desuccinylase